MLRRVSPLLVASLALVIAGCPSNPNNPPGDTGPTPDGGDAGPRTDGGPIPDGGNPDGGMTGPIVTVCPGDALPPLASGVCEVTGSGPGLLIQADVLAPGHIYRGGQVMVDTTGTITCVGCDCSSAAGAAAATHVTCPDGVLSPGLVNAHEHLSFEGNPYNMTAERYEHRHDWRKGLNGHTRIGSMMATADATRWAELRMVLGGATSINGSGGQAGFLRNLDRGTMEGLAHAAVDYNTFPLGDSAGTEIAMGCTGYSTARTTTADIMADTSFTPHIAEGIGAAARNEFLCQMDGMFDLIQPQTAIIHGVGMLPIDMQVMATDGAMLIWSPRSNVTLYGDTARVVEYDRMGVPIAMGTDWVFTGSMNMLRELQCADELNATYYGDHFTDEQLWTMATYNGAVALAADDLIGSIATGHVADLAIFDGSMHLDYRAVIDAAPGDVALVLRGGVPLYGEDAVVSAIPTGGAGCETIDVCGHPRRACVMREVGVSLATLSASNASSYPLFFCGTPMNEPSCRPERDAMSPLPSPVVMGSNSYTGMTSATDADGDGIADAMDNCPSVFNAIRPLDNGMQADSDMDGLGDSCDPCPLDAMTTSCGGMTANDRDHDGVLDAMDNCPSTANPDQADADMDGTGDACDPCPMAPNPGGTACPVTIYSIQMGTTPVGTRVHVTGVVTAVGTTGFFVQVPTSDPAYTVPDYSGIFVYQGAAPTVHVADAIGIDGTVANYMGELELTMPTVTAMGTGTVPAPVDVMASDIATGGPRARALEGVLARVMGVTVSNAMPAPSGGEVAPTYEFQVASALLVDDFLYRIAPFPVMGENFASITGIVAFRASNTKLEPRTIDDYVAGTPRLVGFGPALSYTRVGSTGAPTFPTPLTVQLTRAVATDTVVMVSSGTPGSLTVVGGAVTVPAGSASAPVLVSGVAQAASVTLTATLGADSVMAAVRVLGAAEGPTTFMLSPSMASVGIGRTQTFTVTLDLPAPAGGQSIGLAETTGGTLPASVVVPADALGATFDFVAGGTPTTGTLTASALSTMQTAALTITSGPPGHLVINEIDYDQPSTDTAEFIELYNGGDTAVDLSNVAVVLVNGTGSAEYGRVTLSGMLASHAYLIVAPSAATLTIPSGVMRVNFPSSVSGIQNGAPDGVALYDTARGVLLDALSYEGAITDASISGHTVSLVEGMACTAIDSGAGSLARIPDGTDTDDAASDWSLSSTPTPGAANVM
jgi:imidazolonepropionase-like amidohydrolase